MTERPEEYLFPVVFSLVLLVVAQIWVWTRRPKIIIGVTGLAGAGKDTFAAATGYRVEKFAQPLKNAVAELIGLPYEYVEDPKLKNEKLPCGFSPREIMQFLGTDLVRAKLGKDFFVEALRNRLKKCNESVIITDVRFDNEAQIIKAMGGIVIEIKRPGLVAMDHASENGVSSYLIDLVVWNDGSIDDLKRKANV